MKRFFILASAAIVALASCVKSEVVYKDGPQQIAFKQITGAMTKATDLATTISLGVIAHDGETKAPYFGNLPFTNTSGYWTNQAAYWPYEGTLTFTVYAPAVAAEKASIADNVLTIQGVEAADALYYATERITTGKVASVPVLLKHISAQITVNVTLGSAYVLNGDDAITLTAPTTAGTVAVTYSDKTVDEVTTCTVDAVSTTVVTTDTDRILESGEPVYVLPGAQTSLVVKFKQTASPYQTYEKEIPLTPAVWDANTKYTYNIGITAPDQIKFTAQVDDWAEADAVSCPLN